MFGWVSFACTRISLRKRSDHLPVAVLGQNPKKFCAVNQGVSNLVGVPGAGLVELFQDLVITYPLAGLEIHAGAPHTLTFCILTKGKGLRQ